MKKGDFLFVYGTLRRGERADITKNVLIHSTSFVAEDRINGLMYHLGAFPGVKLLVEPPEPMFDPELPCVLGEVHYIGDQSVVSILDHYEGYHSEAPTSGLYNRHPIRTQGGRIAWVYTYNSPVIEDQLIETGDWKTPRLHMTKRIPRVN